MNLRLLCLTLVACLTLPVLADDAVVADLRQRLDATTSLEGTFTQTLTDADGALLEESKGVFAVQRPGKFYWETQEPYEQLLVSNHETIWLYDPDLEQVTVRRFNDDLQQTPALLLSGDLAQIQKHFAISRVGGEEAFRLTPSNQDGLFQVLVLIFKNSDLTEIQLEDSLGQVSRFMLQANTRNQNLSPSRFEFTAPEGVDILVD